MRLTVKTDLCLRVLIYLQTNKSKAKIQEIAEAYGISKNHLSVAVNKLSELGYVSSTFGPKGGIVFNPEFGDHTVGDLIKQIEDMNMVECFNSETNNCTLNPHCRLKGMLSKASRAFIKELQNFKIKDLV